MSNNAIKINVEDVQWVKGKLGIEIMPYIERDKYYNFSIITKNGDIYICKIEFGEINIYNKKFMIYLNCKENKYSFGKLITATGTYTDRRYFKKYAKICDMAFYLLWINKYWKK